MEEAIVKDIFILLFIRLLTNVNIQVGRLIIGGLILISGAVVRILVLLIFKEFSLHGKTKAIV